MNRRTIVTAIVILIASILAPLQIDAAEQATPTPSSPELVESDGDDDGGEPAVKPRTPEVRNIIVNMHASGGQWSNAEGNLQNHNLVKTRLVIQRDLLKYALDDNPDRFSRRRLAEKNNEIRLHLAYAPTLVDKVDKKYEQYEKDWHTLDNLYLKHLPEGHPDKIRFEKMGNTEENRVIHPETLLDLSMSCKNGCGVSFADTGNSLAAFEAAVNAHYTGVCNVKPHNGLRYYDCPDKPGSCPAPREH